MSDPRRLSDEDPAAAALLGAARSYRVSPETRSRTLKMLGLPVAASLASTAVGTAVAGTAKAWIIASALVVASGGGAITYRVVKERRAPRPVVSVPAKSVRPRPIIQPAPVAPIAPEPPAPVSAARPVAPSPVRRMALREPPVVVPVPVPVQAQPAPSPQPIEVVTTPLAPPIAIVPPPVRSAPTMPMLSPQPKAPPARRTPLAGELLILDDAAQAVRDGNARRALARLDEYGRMYPHGALQEEAVVLRIQAFLASGDRARAQILANDFINQHPRSVLAERVRALFPKQ